MSAPVIPLTESPDIVKSDRLDLLTAGTYGSTGTYVWTEVKGLKSLTAPNNYSTQDTSTFNTGTLGSDMPTQYKKQLTGTLQKYVADDITHQQLKAAGEPDTGATFSLVMVRLYNRQGNGTGKQGIGFVQWEPQGGAGDAVKTNNFVILMQTWDDITNPASVTPTVVVLSSALPASKTTGDWVEVTSTGTPPFDTSITDVTVGGVTVGAATNRIVVSPTKLHIKLPTHASGSAPIIVTNAGGASSAQAYTMT